jgi:hypothetical protein
MCRDRCPEPGFGVDLDSDFGVGFGAELDSDFGVGVGVELDFGFELDFGSRVGFLLANRFLFTSASNRVSARSITSATSPLGI